MTHPCHRHTPAASPPPSTGPPHTPTCVSSVPGSSRYVPPSHSDQRRPPQQTALAFEVFLTMMPWALLAGPPGCGVVKLPLMGRGWAAAAASNSAVQTNLWGRGRGGWVWAGQNGCCSCCRCPHTMLSFCAAPRLWCTAAQTSHRCHMPSRPQGRKSHPQNRQPCELHMP